MKAKKGQLEIGFNWIYILVAGAVILMFFVGLGLRQKVVSEQKLSGEVLREIEGIFTGAGLSKQTVNIVEVPEITLTFTCDEATGYSEYAVKGTGVKAETAWQPIFAPPEVKGQKLLTWTLEWQMPFRVINYLLISSPNIKYYILSSEIELPEQFNSEKWPANNYREIPYNQEEQVRLIFGDNRPDSFPVPESLWSLADEKVTAVDFSTFGIGFYQKEKVNGQYIFVKKGTAPLIDSFTADNPNLYGAIFSTRAEDYKCNLKKAFQRLSLVNAVYQGKTDELNNYYQSLGERDPRYSCGYVVREENGVLLDFDDLAKAAQLCAVNLDDSCGLVSGPATGIYEDNKKMPSDCPVIY